MAAKRDSSGAGGAAKGRRRRSSGGAKSAGPSGKSATKRRSTTKRRARKPAKRIAGGDVHVEPAEYRPDLVHRAESLDDVRERLGLDEIDEVDKQMIAAVLQAPSITNAELGALVGLKEPAARKRRNRPAFQRSFDFLVLDAVGVLQANQRRAAEKMGELLESPVEIVAYKAAEFHLKPGLARLLSDVKGAGSDAGFEDWLGLLEQSYQDRKDAGIVKQIGSASTPAASGGAK